MLIVSNQPVNPYSPLITCQDYSVNKQISQVPTNIVTGFLGTGKTSTIQHLLKYKPSDERWAILVNEFGTVGIDGTMYQKNNQDKGGVFVREVPGGCMCCVSGLPMQIALNVLLKLSDPDRLLIEPSGLGHPLEVMSMLKSRYYQEVLDIQKTITVIDPQQLLQSRYRSHPTYQQQLAMADVVVINKIDGCDDENLRDVKQQIKQAACADRTCHYTEFGQIDPDILLGETAFKSDDKITISHHGGNDEWPDEPLIPVAPGYLKSVRSDEGYYGSSWRYHQDFTFSKHKLLHWLKGVKATRIKGVFITDQGVMGVNMLPGQTQISVFDSCEESRIEIISETIDSNWDAALAACVIA